MSENIKSKTLSGLTWSAIDNFASQGITFLVGILLARILSPSEFGTLGIAMIFVGLFNKIVDCGFSSSLIRKQDVSYTDYNTAFWFNVMISILLYIVCFLFSPFFSSFFANNELTTVLRWMSIVVIINAFGIVQKTRLIKRIDFKTQTKISLISSLVSGFVGIIAAYYGLGVMSLVYQQLVRQSTNTLLLWLCNKWSPKFEFSFVSFTEQFSYGSKLLVSGLIDYFFNEVASLVIGKIYSPSTLGQYSRARQFSSIFSSNFSSIMERVTFPVFSKLQNDKDVLVISYQRIVRCLMLISGFFMVTLAATSESVVLLLVGDKWSESIVYLQIICFNDIFYPVKQVNLNAIKVVGRSDLILKVTILKRFIQLPPIILGFFNIYYMLYGLVIASFLGLLLNAYYASICIPYSVKQQMKDIIHPIIICSISGICMYAVTFCGFTLHAQLIIQILLGFPIFLISISLLKFPEYKFLKDTFLSIIQKNKFFML